MHNYYEMTNMVTSWGWAVIQWSFIVWVNLFICGSIFIKFSEAMEESRWEASRERRNMENEIRGLKNTRDELWSKINKLQTENAEIKALPLPELGE